ncbi:MAG: hypothetical protein WCF91_01405 [bacterium]
MLFSRKKPTISRQRKINVPLSPNPENMANQTRRSSLNRPNTIKKTPAMGSSSRLRAFLSRLGVLLLIIGLGLVLYFVTSLSGQPSVKVVPNDYQLLLRDPAIYQQYADQFLGKSVFNKSKLTINSKGLSRDMTKQYPELAMASVNLPLLSNRPVVNVEAAPVALILTSSSGVYAIGYNGKTLASTDDIPSVRSMRLPKVGDSGGINIAPGQQALSSSNVHFIVSAIKILEAKGLKATSTNINNASSELDINIDSKPYIIKFNLQSDTPKEQVGTLLATLKQLQKDNIEPTKYIDVRVSGRAYYQ